GVGRGEDAMEVLVRRDHDLVAVQRDLTGAGGDRGAGDGALAVLERVRIVVQDGDRVGLAGVDRDGVHAGGDEGRLRAADGGLDGRGDGRVRAVLDGDGDVDDGSLGDFRAGLHTQGGAVEGDAELTAGRPL